MKSFTSTLKKIGKLNKFSLISRNSLIINSKRNFAATTETVKKINLIK